MYGFKDCPRFTEFWEIHSELAQVYIDGVDSTPLLEGERGEDRQKTMMSIVLAYMNHAKLRGFKRLYLRIAPPTDENGFIFRRLPNVRFRASLHLSLWFKYIVQAASRNGRYHQELRLLVRQKSLDGGRPGDQGPAEDVGGCDQDDPDVARHGDAGAQPQEG